MKVLGLTVAIALLTLPQSLSACPNVASSSKWQNSPIVVEGVARCDHRQGRCSINVESILKGEALLRQSGEDLEVVVRPTSEDEFYCGIEWTPYDDDQLNGRFYLKPSEDGLFTAPYWPDQTRDKNDEATE